MEVCLDAVRQAPPALAPCSRARRRPHVTVCIVNWNCKELLRQCLLSLRSSRQGVRIQVIVVDNASSDGAAEMVERNFPGVRLVRNSDNVGFSRANNQAAQKARGRWILFLNNDTIVPRQALRRLVRFAAADREIGMVGPLLRDGDGKPQASFRGRPTVGALLHHTAILRWTRLFHRAHCRCRARGEDLRTRAVDVLMGAALLMRRRDFRRFGPWDEKFTFGGEDIDLCVRVGRHKRVVYHPGVEITHFGRVSSRRHAAFAHAHTLIGHTRFLRKHGAHPVAVAFLKAAITLDVPIQVLRRAVQFAWRQLRGRPNAAARSLLCLHADWHFLTRSLPAFWRA